MEKMLMGFRPQCNSCYEPLKDSDIDYSKGESFLAIAFDLGWTRKGNKILCSDCTKNPVESNDNSKPY